MTFFFGSHIHVDDFESEESLEKAAKKVKAAGGNMIQIMLNEPINKKDINKNILYKFKEYLIKHNIKVVIHSSYMHNMARNWDAHSWWLNNLESEIKYANYIGAIGVVLHFGKKMDLTKEEAYNNMYTSLVHVNNMTLKYKHVKIFLETSTGQGSEMCYKLEDLAHFYKKFSKSENKQLKHRIKLCLDTCHIFSAGYDLRNKLKVKMYLEAFEELVGLRYIGLIHLNDSKVEIGSQVDRHQNIGQGYIGLPGLVEFFKYFKKLKVPIVLETPNSGYKTEIKLILNS
jgi:deoxyribonuclease-4